MKVRLHTLGCKVNQYETQGILEDLIKNGFEITLSDEDADVYIVNSCTVTSESDRKTRQLVRHLKQKKPESIVVLTGCMPQAFPDMAEALTQADIVIGNKNNTQIIGKLRSYIAEKERIFDVTQHLTGEKFYGNPIESFNERTRAIVKIEDGCDRFCSYCIIPKARGRVRSKPIAEIKAEVKTLAEAGFCEVVLVGINLSAYGKDTGETFYNAVRAAAEQEGIQRVRLGSLEPDHLTDEVLSELAKIPNLCPQFHISLQSGCDTTLKAMNRHYTAGEYKALCDKLRSTFADCTLTTDIMVGFPTETQEDFLETIRFAQKIGFEKIHIFPYSVRSGTRAAAMSPQIERHVKANRAATLGIEAAKIRRDFLKSQIGREVEILVETKTDGEYCFGYTANYTPVFAKLPHDSIGKLARVKITDSNENYCYAD